jgi:hypothetical protein
MKPRTLLPRDFRDDEIHVQHDGTEWIVSSHVDVQHRFEYLADSMKYANQLHDQHRGEDRPRVILHRAYSPLAK